jgi:hypothetical protein
MEYVGAVEVEPPFRSDESEWLVQAQWTTSGDGRMIRPHGRACLADAVRGLRNLVDIDTDSRSYEGVVAAYDPSTHQLATISVRGGRVTRRWLGKARAVLNRDNVIDLATHRRTISHRVI